MNGNSVTLLNQIKPSEKIYTSNPEEAVKLKIPPSGKMIETLTPVSIPSVFQRIVRDYADRPALSYKSNNSWQTMSYREYEDNIKTVAKAFIYLGLERYHSVGIIGFNSKEWMISNFAAIFAGGMSAGIYTTNSPDACLHCAECSRANIIVAEDEKQIEKIQSIRSKLPKLKAVIQYEGEPKHSDVISWEQVLKIGKEQNEDRLNERLKSLGVNECCTLVFTSGTIGNPKAAMLTHDNLIWSAINIIELLSIDLEVERILSFLPLSHIAAQMVDIYIPLNCAGTVYFADKNALKGTLVDSMKEVLPTTFFAVPRVWEKIHEKMMQVAAQNSGLKKIIASWAKSHALQYHMDKINRNDNPTWKYSLAKTLIFKRVKQALGLDQCLRAFSGAAPLSPDIKKYFFSIDIPVFDALGLSEVSAALTLCNSNNYGLNTIGIKIPGIKTKILNPDENGHGEICCYGRNVFMGYLGELEKTVDVINDEGWFNTGDVGYIDENNLHYITGRTKEILITAGGENVAPVPIEMTIKSELPNISNVVVIGDQRKFLSVLLTLKTDIDLETMEPLDTLTKEVKEWLTSLGCQASTVTEVLAAGPDEKLITAIQEAIDRANKKAISNAQKIQKFAILPADLSLSTGEYGPTMKLKRNVITKKYETIINNFYS